MKFGKLCAGLCAMMLVCGSTAAGLPGTLAVYADADLSGTCGENVTWTYDQGTCTLTISGTGDMKVAGGSNTIPWESWRSEIKTVIVEDGVTGICNSAFFQCTSITQVTLADSITSIGRGAFHYCNSLKEIKLPANLKVIGEEAFCACHGLIQVDLPAAVEKISKDAFAPCGSIAAFTVAADNQYFAARDGVLFSKDLTKLIQYPAAKTDQQYTIPSGVTQMDAYAFKSAAFLEKATVPEGVTVIPEFCFSSCPKLTSVSLPNSLTTIEKGGFYWSPKLTSVNLPDNLTSISTLAFQRCSKLADVEIPAGVNVIGGKAFGDTAWLTAKQQEDPVVIINNILLDASTDQGETFTIPSNVSYISGYAFIGRKDLKSVTIPNTVTYVGEWAFEDCDALDNVVLPESVTEVGNGAFQKCPLLKRITFLNKECIISNSPATVSNGIIESTSNWYYSGTICGYTDSTAQTFCERWGYHFEALDHITTEPNPDMDSDGKITASDAQIVLVAYADILASGSSDLTEEQLAAADVNGDGMVTAVDAQYILIYYLRNSVMDESVTWEEILNPDGN